MPFIHVTGGGGGGAADSGKDDNEGKDYKFITISSSTKGAGLNVVNNETLKLSHVVA